MPGRYVRSSCLFWGEDTKDEIFAEDKGNPFHYLLRSKRNLLRCICKYFRVFTDI